MAIDEVPLEELRRRLSAKWRTYPSDVLPAWVAEMDFTLAEPIAHALRSAVDNSDTGYRWADDVPAALAEFASDEWNWQINPGNVTVLADVMSSVGQSLLHLTDPGSTVVINPPVYPPFFSTVEKVASRHLRDVPLIADAGRYRLDMEGLAEAFADPAVQAYLLCSPHNPTGTVHAVEDLRRIADLAAEHDVVVIADEVHAPMTLAGAQHTPFLKAAADVADLHAVAIMSASKTWNIPGLKCAQVVAAPTVVERLRERLPTEVTYLVGHFGVLASLAAYREGTPWRREMLAALDSRRRQLFTALQDMAGVSMTWPEASYLAWVRVEGLGDDPAEGIREQGKVALTSGSAFGSPGVGHVRINFATSEAILAEVVSRVGSVVAAHAS
jgi:cystathionine beta-lyase